MKKKNKFLGMSLLTSFATFGMVVSGCGELASKVSNESENDETVWEDKTAKARASGLNVVLLGDSISSGYNGYLADDRYLSYGEFLAQDMRNVNVLNEYHNFAVSGAVAADVTQQVSGAAAVRPLNAADVVILTVGGNDLLAHIKVLGMGINDLTTLLGELTKILDSFTSGVNLGIEELLPLIMPVLPLLSNFSDEEVTAMIEEIFAVMETGEGSQLIGMATRLISEAAKHLSDKDFEGVITVDQSPDIVFAQIQDSIAKSLEAVRAAAPNANILLLGPSFPFLNIPSEITAGIIQGMSGMEAFKNFTNAAIKGAAANFANVRYQAIEDIPEYRDDNSARPGSQALNIDDPMFRYRKMPNALDIHPSTYGHQLIGNGLFRIYAREFGVLEVNDEDLVAPGDSLLDGDGKPIQYNNILEDENPLIDTTLENIFRSLIGGDPVNNFYAEIVRALNAIPALFNVETFAPASNTVYDVEVVDNEFVIKNDLVPNVLGELGNLAEIANPLLRMLFGESVDLVKVFENFALLTPALDALSNLGLDKLTEFLNDPTQIGVLEDDINMLGLGFQSILDEVSPILKSQGLSEALATSFITINNAFEMYGQGMTKPMEIFQEFLARVRTLMFSEAQYQAINDQFVRHLATSGTTAITAGTSLADFGFVNFETEYGVKNFGELAFKFNITQIYQSMYPIIELVVHPVKALATNTLDISGLLTDNFAMFIAKNQGIDFLERVLLIGDDESHTKLETALHYAIEGAKSDPTFRATLEAHAATYQTLLANIAPFVHSGPGTLLATLDAQARSNNFLFLKNALLGAQDVTGLIAAVNQLAGVQVQNVAQIVDLLRSLDAEFTIVPSLSNLTDPIVMNDVILFNYIKGGNDSFSVNLNPIPIILPDGVTINLPLPANRQITGPLEILWNSFTNMIGMLDFQL